MEFKAIKRFFKFVQIRPVFAGPVTYIVQIKFNILTELIS